MSVIAGLSAVLLLPLAAGTQWVAAQNTSPQEASTTACATVHQTPLSGTVRDSTQALLPGAVLTLDTSRSATSGADGSFRFACVPSGPHRLSIAAEGFATADLTVTLPHGAVPITLQVGSVAAQVEVNADEDAALDPNGSGASTTLSGKQLQGLADDPDDLLRELQQLGAMNGGSPANTVISVNGFQGSSRLPPKSAIAYIRVNPDLYSAEYQTPPYDGGRVEIYTKPGQSTFHGALFTTNGSPWENARDPFSPNKASIGKQRYGFELSGPVRKHGSDFAMNFEHRAIDNFSVVNAITLDSAGNQVSTVANVPTPQALSVGELRVDWQLGAKNTFMATYDANVNSLQNVGTGGTMLAETGYNSARYDHTLRLTNITTASPHAMHETRVSLRWDGEDDTPNSTAPQLQVAGTFTSGGATLGPQQLHEFNLEADDDAVITAKSHSFKFGTELMLFDEHQQLTTNFNGTYTFGGGTAPVLDGNNQAVPGQTETIAGLEQYRRALLHLPGGTPTAFSNVVGTPGVNFTQVQEAVYLQDEINAGHGVHVAAGVRYYLQNDPLVLNSIDPRFSVLWSPGKKGPLTLHAHTGMFSTIFAEADQAEVMREDGTARVTSTIYNPVYGSPFTNATPVHSAREYSPHIANISSVSVNFGGTYRAFRGWTVMADYSYSRDWNDLRSANVNAPLNGSPTGPRLLGIPNLDLLQMQNSAQSFMNFEFFGIEQHTLKYLRLFAAADRGNIISDSDDNHLFTPQSTFTDAGEFAHITNFAQWQIYSYAGFTLPRKVQLSGNFNGRGDQHYNITTGFDNNGDGDFNDRPQYAALGTPGAVATPFGLLVSSGGAGVFPRNKGVLPWQFYLDANLQRAFTLTRNPKAEHQQVVTVNLRSSNVLNHTNVTQVGSVLGSPLFGVPYQADNGRRVEAGVRYSF